MGKLKATARSEAEEDLVANPLARTSVGFKGCQESGADGSNNHRKVDEGDVVSDLACPKSREEDTNNVGENKRDGVDARFEGGRPFDSLKVDGYEVAEKKESTREAKREQTRGKDCSLLGDTRWDYRCLLVKLTVYLEAPGILPVPASPSQI